MILLVDSEIHHGEQSPLSSGLDGHLHLDLPVYFVALHTVARKIRSEVND